jgi:hypothetical protein
MLPKRETRPIINAAKDDATQKQCNAEVDTALKKDAIQSESLAGPLLAKTGQLDFQSRAFLFA